MAVSILEVLGEEVTGIGPRMDPAMQQPVQSDVQALTSVCRLCAAAPVSICIALTVVLIRILNPNGKSDRSVFIATVFYSEQAPY